MKTVRGAKLLEPSPSTTYRFMHHTHTRDHVGLLINLVHETVQSCILKGLIRDEMSATSRDALRAAEVQAMKDRHGFMHSYVSVIFIYARNEYHSRGLHSELTESDCEMSTTAETALRAQTIRIVTSRPIQTFVN